MRRFAEGADSGGDGRIGENLAPAAAWPSTLKLTPSAFCPSYFRACRASEMQEVVSSRSTSRTVFSWSSARCASDMAARDLTSGWRAIVANIHRTITGIESGLKEAPPGGETGTPSHLWYHAPSALGSRARKKTPPIPTTRAVCSPHASLSSEAILSRPGAGGLRSPGGSP